MGLEAKTKVEWKGATTTARLHLDSNQLDVFVKPALHVPFEQIRSAVAKDGELRITFDQGLLVLQLGAAADRWGQKIRQPKSRLDKLGVKTGDLRVALIGLHDAEFEAELLSRIDKLFKKPVVDADLVFFRASSPKDLTKLKTLRGKLAAAGALWVVREKGKAAAVKESEVRVAAKAAGLVDVKVVAFSDTLTADKFVIPVAAR
ncbi:MAG TPA: DUF3052 family protein [Polyangiales bacterium]|jgi:hypothetical protein|nr:DUF3052 family protein [Polyangiales bacterium]